MFNIAILSIQKYLVTPFVGVIPYDFTPIPNLDEIESVFRVPLSFFMKSNNHWAEEYQASKAIVFMHHFDFEGYDIWGMTAKLILRLLEIGLDHVPDFPVHHGYPPVWTPWSLRPMGDLATKCSKKSKTQQPKLPRPKNPFTKKAFPTLTKSFISAFSKILGKCRVVSF